jgi:parallel beta-helix repeat protein
MSQRPWQTPALHFARLRPVRLLSIAAGVALASTVVVGRPVGGALDVDFGTSATAQAATITACPSSMQSLINGAASGSTITIPACTFHQSVTISKPLTLHATGAVIDGDGIRSTGLVVLANDVTVTGLTVTGVNASGHVGAVWVNGPSRFTFSHGVIRNSSPICISFNGGSGHSVLSSELANCSREGYFLTGVSNARIAGNHIHDNNPQLANDPQNEAGGGKVSESSGVRFEGNEVDHNRGPGIWYDNHSSNGIVTGNRVHHNDWDGIFFEISNRVTISGNSIWENGWGRPAWGYGAGITISSSDNATVANNTVAWNARQISVISQNRNSPPHVDNVVHGNVMASGNGNLVAGWYSDNGTSLFSSTNGNHGYSDKFWVAVKEPSSNRFAWNGPRSTLSSYNSTRGEEGGTYLSTAARDAALAAAGVPGDDGTPVSGPPKPAPPRLGFRSGQIGSIVPTVVTWPATSGAAAYRLQIQHDNKSFETVRLSSAKAHIYFTKFSVGHTYRARVKVKYSSGLWSGWSYSAASLVVRHQENTSAATYSGTWARVPSPSASADHLTYSYNAGAKASYTFTGRAFAWVAPKSSSRGSAKVSIDGAFVKNVSLYRTSSVSRYVVFYTSFASSGSHTITIEVIGTAGHARVDVDAFAILR